jgi:hypothetical protein
LVADEPAKKLVVFRDLGDKPAKHSLATTRTHAALALSDARAIDVLAWSASVLIVATFVCLDWP